jgi:pimeloyl-ACP methyl ester carboxylesterase
MPALADISQWIAANESVLSGIAALVAVAGVCVSSVLFLVGRLRAGKRDAEAAAAAVPSAPYPSSPDSRQSPGASAPVEKLTLHDFSRPAPQTIHYAGPENGRIAYISDGKGDPPIIMTPGIVSHLHIAANLPTFRDTFAAMAAISRVIHFDKRGQGLSDPYAETASLAQRAEEIGTVMDDAGIDRALVLGFSEGGPMAVQFAHTYPERCAGLVLAGTTACWLRSEDFPIGLSERSLDALRQIWGTPAARDLFFPSLSRDQVDDDTFNKVQLLFASRSYISQLSRFLKEVDVRPLLPELALPVLVLHFTGDLAVPMRLGRALAEGIPGARLLALAGTDHADFAHSPEAIDAIREFHAALR